MSFLSFFLGRKFYQTPESFPRIVVYPIRAVLFWYLSIQFDFQSAWMKWTFITMLMFVFVAIVGVLERQSIKSLMRAITNRFS